MPEPDAAKGAPGSGGFARTSGPAWLQVRGLAKEFGGVQALDGVDFDVWRGVAHGLVGANGAGKSTLIRCLAGLHVPDAGTISVAGETVTLHTPHAASRLGFAFIHQELNLVPHFSALQNMLLGMAKPARLGLVDWGAARKRTASAVDRLGISFPLDTRVDELSVAERWMVSIGRALVGNATMIAMDEPTASLSAVECERLFGVVRELSGAGVAVLYVSHRLTEILELCDTVSVFRDGRVTRRASRGDLTRASLVREIAGRDLVAAPAAMPQPRAARGDAAAAAGDPPLVELRDVSRAGVVRDVSFAVRAGEVLGLAGLVGSGRTELARMLVAADRMDSGTVLVHGEPLRLRNVAAAVRRGIVLVPEERRSEGLSLDHSVAFNLNIADLRPLRRVRWLPLIHRGRARARAHQLVQRLGIKIASTDQPVGGLSGGNQQKVLIARWLTRDLDVLILDELSRGVDVGARSEIHEIVRQLARAGTAIIAISSEVEELVELCDRVVVMSEGQVAGELAGPDLTQEKVIALCYRHVGDGKQEMVK